MVSKVFPESSSEKLALGDRLLSHALTCVSLVEEYQVKSLPAFRLIDKAGSYLRDRARYSEAEPLFQRALAIRETALGLDHPDVAKTLKTMRS